MFPFFGLLEGVDKSLALSTNTVSDFVIATDTATASARLNTNGDYEDRSGGFGSWVAHAANQWINDEFAALPAFDPSKYECGFFSVSGSTSYLTGTIDTYLALSSIRVWTLSRTYTGFGMDSVTGQLRVREIANPSNEVTATLTLSISAEL